MADVIVLGGGIAGLSAAAALSAGARVLLLEAERDLGYHASGRSAAMFLPSYGNAAVRALNEASAEALATMGALAPRGLLLVAPAAKTSGFDAETAAIGLRRIACSEARALMPILDPRWLARAATAAAWDLDTDRCLGHFRRVAQGGGAQIVTAARVDRIERVGAVWHVAWDGGEARAGLIVNAAGAWADAVAALAGVTPLGLVPHRRSAVLLAAPGGRDVSDWPFVEEVGEAWYAKPEAGRLLVSPADADPVAPFDAWPDDIVLAEGLDRYAAAVTEPLTRPLHSWAGLRTFAADRVPVVGPDPRMPDFWWCAGQGGYGFQTAPALAGVLADRVAGRAPALGAAATALDPARLGT